ncbi:M48 family metallopeptidase [Actinokineospora sp. 24-640]
MKTELPERMLVGDLEFAVQSSSSRRTVGITVDRDGALLLHAPASCPPGTLATWAHGKRHWVYAKLAEKDLLLAPPVRKEFVSGEGFDYLGRRYRLLVVDDDRAVRLERGRLRISRPEGADAVIRWYRQRALAWLPSRIRSWSLRAGMVPGALDVRDLGYRWGSLGKGDRFNLHWAAMQLPASLVDYVIVHELVHIKHANHTPEFWALVARVMPDFEVRKNRLAIAGARLWLGQSV